MLALFTTATSPQVMERGGLCVPVVCDSTKDADIEELFDQIKREQKGRLDVLVNNAYAGVQVQYVLHRYTRLMENCQYMIGLNVMCYCRTSLKIWGKSSGKLIHPFGIPSITRASGLQDI